MTSPGNYSAGTAFLDVVPSFRGVQRAIRREAQKWEKALGEGAGDTLGDALEKNMVRSVDRALDTTKAKARTKGRESGEEFAEGFGLFERTLHRRIDNALKNIKPLKFDADTSRAESKLQALRKQLIDLRAKNIGIDINGSAALREIEGIRAELASLADQDVDVRVKTDADGAMKELLLLRKIAESVDGKKVEVEAKADTDRATRRLEDFRRTLQRAEGSSNGAGNAFRAFNFVVLGVAAGVAAAVPVLGVLAGGLALLGPLALGAIAGLGVLAAGFSGITDAVKALGKEQQNATKDAEDHATKVRAAAGSVADAEQSLASARESAARSARDSAESVQDAIDGVALAERDVAQAYQESKDAQEALTDARKAAREEMEDLSLQLRDASLDERETLIRLKQAKADLAVDRGRVGPGGDMTNEELQMSILKVERLQLTYDTIKERQGDLNAEQREWARTGVEGSDQVVSAHRRVADAQQGIQDATQRVRDAEQAVSDARRDAADAARQSQVSIASAQRNLTEAQERYNSALDETSTSARNVAIAMAGLGPAGQHFAEFIHGLRDDFREMRDLIQQGMLPGVESALTAIFVTNGPLLRAFLKDMGALLGDLFTQFGELMTSPEWKRIWATFTQYVPDFFRQFFEIAMNMLTFFGELFVGLAPYADSFGDTLVRVSETMVDWMREFVNSERFHALMEWLFTNGPIVFDAILDIFRAIGNLFVALEPLGGVVLGLIDSIAEFIAWLDPDVLGAIVTIILGLVVAFQIAQGAIALVAGVMGLLGSGFGLIVFAAGAVITGLIALWTQSETFRDIIAGVFRVIGAVIKVLWEEIILPIFTLIGEIFMLVWDILVLAWEGIGKPVFEAIGAVIGWLWEHIIKPVFHFIGDVLRGFIAGVRWVREHLDPIMDAIAAPFQWLWENVVKPIFGWFSDRFREFIAALRWVRERVHAILDIVGKSFESVRDVINAALADTLEEWQGWVEAIIDAWTGEEGSGEAAMKEIKDQFTALKDEAEDGFPKISAAWDIMWQSMKDAWFGTEETGGKGVFSGIMGTVDELGIAFEDMGTTIGDAWSGLWSGVGDTWNAYGFPIFDFFRDAVNMILDVAKIGWETISYYWNALMDVLNFGWFGGGSQKRTGGKAIFDSVGDESEGMMKTVLDVLAAIGEEFEGLMHLFTDMWSIYGQPFIETMKGAWRGFRDFFGNIVDQVAQRFSGLINTITRLSRFVIKDIINDIFIDGFNNLAESVGSDARMKRLPVPGDFNVSKIPLGRFGGGGDFYAGGPTARVGKYVPAGIVHGGEYVEPMEAVDQYRGTGILEAIHKRRIPRHVAAAIGRMAGYASGGYVEMSRIIGRQFPWARITSGYRPGDPGYHGSGQAIDIAGARPYPDPTGRSQMLGINRWLAKTYGTAITELIHTAPGAINLWHGQPHRYNQATQMDHMDHVHWAMTALSKGAGILGSLLGGLSDLVTSPVSYLTDKIKGALGGFKGKSTIHDIVGSIPEKILSMAGDKITDLVSMFSFDNTIPGSASPAPAASKGNVALVKAMAASRGWTGGEWNSLYSLIMKESGFSNTAQNPTSTAYGMFQFLNSTWGATGIGKTSDPRLQTEAGLRYIASRYGSPSAALSFHRAHNWYSDGGEVTPATGITGVTPDAPTLYDTGGWLPPGITTVLNASQRPEPILTAQQWDELVGAREGGADGAGGFRELHLHEQAYSVGESVAALNQAVKVQERGGRYRKGK